MSKVLVYGLKLSGESVVEFLNNKCDIIVYDENEKTLSDFCLYKSSMYSFKRLESLKDFENLDLVVKSPGISDQNKLVQYLKRKKIKIENELDFASKYIKGNIVSVSGTNGKSTVCSLIYDVLKKDGENSFIAGNIGRPLTSLINKCNANSNIVVESSSFQLDKIYHFHPKVSVLINVAPDHINWHGSYKNYIQAKKNIFKMQNENDFCVLNYDDELLVKLHPKANTYYFSMKYKVKGVYLSEGVVFFNDGQYVQKLFPINLLNIVGKHNLYNYLCSICVCKLLKVSNETIFTSLKDFKGLEHRYEFVSKKKGVVFINDSKATNVASAIVAIKGCDNGIRLLLGGSDKGENFDELFKIQEFNKVECCYIYGETASSLVKSAVKFGVRFMQCENMKTAFLSACHEAKKNEIVLLSPACASFDEFNNFEERGKYFKELVNKI